MFGRTILSFILFSVLLGLLGRPLSAAETISTELLSVTVDQGRYAIQARRQKTPFATGALRCQGAPQVTSVSDAVFGQGQALTVADPGGAHETFQVFPGLPFVLHQRTLVNASTAATVLNRVPLTDATLELGQPLDRLMALGTGGLYPLAKNTGSYAWMAVADPTSRAGIVGGWLTYGRGSGVIFTKAEDGKLTLEARMEYGGLRLEPGASAASETFLLGWFADARLGMEAWAEAVARHMAIRLPPPPVVYCTWYDNVHRRAGSAASTAELAAFAARELKPYGFTCVQIDDGWQLGEKSNGPRKNFTGHDPKGPYPDGMKPTAAAIQAQGLTAGLWLLPFGGNCKDPFFAPHPDWFVKKADGTPFDNPWGGTCLDMSDPGAREFVRGEMKQAMQDWGYRYFKLDGLYGGMGVQPRYVNSGWQEDNFGEGVFHDQTQTNVEVYRAGLHMVRETVSPQSFILGC
ncbi:MAG: alpha-galactosidase, partial [Planctomycetes bacterium]|nr:alpha-galactosidase [Planctomycetota bacterium]